MEPAVLFGIQTHFALRLRTLRYLHRENNFIWDRRINGVRPAGRDGA